MHACIHVYNNKKILDVREGWDFHSQISHVYKIGQCLKLAVKVFFFGGCRDGMADQCSPLS